MVQSKIGIYVFCDPSFSTKHRFLLTLSCSMVHFLQVDPLLKTPCILKNKCRLSVEKMTWFCYLLLKELRLTPVAFFMHPKEVTTHRNVPNIYTSKNIPSCAFPRCFFLVRLSDGYVGSRIMWCLEVVEAAQERYANHSARQLMYSPLR